MDLCNRNDIQALLLRHGFRFSKSMGQNFLLSLIHISEPTRPY